MPTLMQDKHVAMIGLGRLGLAMALVFEREGYKVLGADLFQSYCDQINNKKLQSREPDITAYLEKSKNLRATVDLDETLEFSDLIFITVDTPTGVAEKSYDHSKLSRVLQQMVQEICTDSLTLFLQNDRRLQNKHVVIVCTVLPGYIRTVGRFLLQDCKNTTLSYNPEFIAQGSIIRDFYNPDMVLIGADEPETANLLVSFYKSFVKNQPEFCIMSPESAEVTKIAINCFITMKISYCNMIGDIADATAGADKFDVLNAVGKDSRIGNKCLKPGYGFGGPCFPRDNRALAWHARSVGVLPMLSEATDGYNKFHAGKMVEAFLAQNKDLYVFEDVAYKENCPVPIIEESQKLVVARELTKAGKRVLIRDRDFIINEVKKEYGNIFEYEVIQN